MAKGNTIGISISIDKEAVEAASEAIQNIMATGHDYHMDQKTIREALGFFTESVGIDTVNISGNEITMGYEYE